MFPPLVGFFSYFFLLYYGFWNRALFRLASDSPWSSCLSLRKTGITVWATVLNTVFRWSLISQFSFMCNIAHMFFEAVVQQSCPVLSCPCLQSFQVHTGSGECPDIHPRQCSKGCNPFPHLSASACALLPVQWLSCFYAVTQNLQSVFLASLPVKDRWHHFS